MAIAVYFTPEALTVAKYNESLQRLEAAGAGAPAGRLHHSCFGTDGELRVYENWDSEDSFGAFGDVLMPILQDVGINPGTPQIMPLQNILN